MVSWTLRASIFIKSTWYESPSVSTFRSGPSRPKKISEVGTLTDYGHCVHASIFVNPVLSATGRGLPPFNESVRTSRHLRTRTGAIEALVAWKNGQLSVLTLWSAWKPSADRSSFFSRLPGLSVYDIVRQAVLTTQP